MEWWWLILVMTRSLGSSADDRWAVTLAGLDLIRAEAYATGDPDLLDAVYVKGSPSRAIDTRAIGDYATRGGRVVGAELKVLSCRVVSTSAGRVRLSVVDQLRDAEVVWKDGSSRALPHDQPTRRAVTLVRTSDGWRISG